MNQRNFGLYADAVHRASLNINKLASFRATLSYALARITHSQPNPDDLYEYLTRYEPSTGPISVSCALADKDLNAYLAFKQTIAISAPYAMSDRLAVGFALYCAIATGHLAVQNG